MSLKVKTLNINGQDAEFITSVTGDINITNQADNEDLININSQIKFKDKEYDPDSFSGLGRVYLRKNIINGVNLLTQEMISSENTIYIIQYDYDLNEQFITVPAGCTLLFNGGSFSNGTILGLNTTINAGLIRIFKDNILIVGKWSICEILPEWFGAKANSNDYELNTNAIYHAAQFSINCRNAENTYDLKVEKAIPIKFSYGRYTINDKIQLSSTATILAHSSGTSIEQIDTEKPIFVIDKNSYLWGSSGSGAYITHISGFTFIGGKRQITLENSNIGGMHLIENCSFVNPNPNDYCIYIDTVSSQVTIRNSRVIHITKFLYIKSDLANISNIDGSVYNINGGLIEDGCFITNNARLLNYENSLLTVGDGTVSTISLNYRLFDNYTYLKINGLNLDGPGGGVPVVYNYVRHTYSDWSHWNNGTYSTSLPASYLYSAFCSAVIIENSTIPIGGAYKSVIYLMEGIPSIINIKNCNYIDGPFIKASDDFDISQYLSDTIGLGTITINISNNNNSNLSYQLIPKELEKYTIIETNNNWLSPKCYIPNINTSLLEGVVCLTIIDENSVICFDVPINPITLSTALVSIGFTTSATSLKARDSIFGVLNFARDNNETTYVKFAELNRQSVIYENNPIEIELVQINDNIESSINIGLTKNSILRIKLIGLTTHESYISLCKCNIIPLFLYN